MSNNSEILNRNFIGSVLPHILNNIIIEDYYKNKIEKVEQILLKRQDLSVIFYCNHMTKFDPLLIGPVVNSIDPGFSRKLIAPVSYSNTEKEKSGNNLMIKALNKCGIKTVRIVQSHQIDNENFDYSREEAMKTYFEFIREVKQIKKDYQQVGCVIYPEGHRNEEGLQKGNNGIIYIGKIFEPVLYVPIGIVFEDKFNSNGLNFGKRVDLSVGNTYLQEKESKKPSLNLLMRNLADALPSRMRGIY